MSTVAIGAAVVFILLNAFFVALEFAILAARRTRIEPLAEQGDRRAAHVLTAMGDLNRQLAGAQLGITATSLGLGFVAEPAIAESLGVGHALGSAIALALVAFLHMLFGEMVPKNITLARPERTALWLAGPMLVFVTLLSPVISLLNSLSNGIVRLLGVEPSDELSTARSAAELGSMVDASRGEGLIDDFDYSLLAGALDLTTRRVGQVMVPRDEVVAVPRTATVRELSATVVASGHSRVPVYHGSLDDVRGFVHAKDLVHLPGEAADGPVPDELVRGTITASGDLTLESLLLAMRSRRLHVAIVEDRRGTTLGMVTLEDVLEELVGDIVDESDRPGAR